LNTFPSAIKVRVRVKVRIKFKVKVKVMVRVGLARVRALTLILCDILPYKDAHIFSYLKVEFIYIMYRR
jgi:hypothetical protein